MSNLVIRHLDPALHARLEARARAHRRTVEEEAVELLRSAAPDETKEAAGESLMEIARRCFGADRGLDEDLSLRRTGPERPPADFSGQASDR